MNPLDLRMMKAQKGTKKTLKLVKALSYNREMDGQIDTLNQTYRYCFTWSIRPVDYSLYWQAVYQVGRKSFNS